MKKCLLFLPIVMILLFCNCTTNIDIPENDKKAISGEIQDRLNGYPEALKNKDIEWFRSFWSDEPGFIFAGDGEIVTDYESFIHELENVLANQKEVLHFKLSNDQINVISRDAASCVVKFDWGVVTISGDTLNARGSWLYIFKRSDDQWHVPYSAGTHIFY
jgi:hypothetical protein